MIGYSIVLTRRTDAEYNIRSASGLGVMSKYLSLIRFDDISAFIQHGNTWDTQPSPDIRPDVVSEKREIH